MDISRPDVARRKKLRQALYAATAVMVIVVVPVGLSRLEPAAPRVDRDTVYLDTVQRGPMTRQMRGAGTLVPEQIRWIPAATDGTVERIVIRPGAPVAPDTVILELSNPELEQSTLEARLNFEAAEARYSNRQVEVERDILDQRATLTTTEAQLKSARLQAAADGRLYTRGLVSSILSKAREALRMGGQNLSGPLYDPHFHAATWPRSFSFAISSACPLTLPAAGPQQRPRCHCEPVEAARALEVAAVQRDGADLDRVGTGRQPAGQGEGSRVWQLSRKVGVGGGGHGRQRRSPGDPVHSDAFYA